MVRICRCRRNPTMWHFRWLTFARCSADPFLSLAYAKSERQAPGIYTNVFVISYMWQSVVCLVGVRGLASFSVAGDVYFWAISPEAGGRGFCAGPPSECRLVRGDVSRVSVDISFPFGHWRCGVMSMFATTLVCSPTEVRAIALRKRSRQPSPDRPVASCLADCRCSPCRS